MKNTVIAALLITSLVLLGTVLELRGRCNECQRELFELKQKIELKSLLMTEKEI